MKNEPSTFTIWHGLLFGEFTALLIALATTIVPGKTGSKYGITGHFFEEPTFLQEFAVNLIFIHIVLISLALLFGVYCWKSGSSKTPTPEE